MRSSKDIVNQAAHRKRTRQRVDPVIAAVSDRRRVYGMCVRHLRSTSRFGFPRVSQTSGVVVEQDLCDGLPL